MGMQEVIRVSRAQKVMLDRLKEQPDEPYVSVMERLLNHAAGMEYSQVKQQQVKVTT